MSALKTFIIYARKDEEYQKQLLKHLRPLIGSDLLTVWHDGNILPGEDWQQTISKELEASELIIVLVSVESLDSDFIQTQELHTALKRLEAGLTRVVPVVVSPCAWKFDPILRRLQALPYASQEGVRPVSEWSNNNLAWANVVERIGEMVEEIAQKREDKRKADIIAEEERLRQINISERLRLQKEHEQQKKQAQDEAWDLATTTNTIAGYESFILTHPDSAHISEARKRIKALRRTLTPVPWSRYVFIGSGICAMFFLIIWLYKVAILPNNDKPISNPVDSLPPPDISTTGIAPAFAFDYKMIKVEGDTLILGQSNPNIDGINASIDECLHPVIVRTFWIGQYEVTQAQWKSIMGSYPEALYNRGCDECPVERVSWYDVQSFIQKLNQLAHQTYRLPTEEEWEFAARGGIKSKGFTYAGSNVLDSVGWYNFNNQEGTSHGTRGTTHPVGQKRPNELELYDMSGNVWEWCQDVYQAYPCDNNKRGNGSDHVDRGGSWYNQSLHCRIANRSGLSPSDHGINVGFRLANTYNSSQ